MKAEAWFLYDSASGPEVLVRESFDVPPPAGDEVIAAPIFGSWEGNMGHAVLRRPIDVCRQRGEARVILGNAGVVRIVERGSRVESLEVGDLAIVFSGSEVDAFGYPTKIWGYDAPGTMGCLATRIALSPNNLIRIPRDTKHALEQWAAFSLRYVTAWSSWSLAHGTYRLLVDADRDPAPHVWGWGGGTTLATLDLGRRFGGRATMLSGNDDRLALIRSLGIDALDRRELGELQFDEARFAAESDYRRAYLRAETSFLARVKEKTGGRGVTIFVDNVGGPVLRATLRALGREGILATCGWKQGMTVSHLRSVACIGRQQHVHTHYAAYREAELAVAYAEASGWMPPVPHGVHTFDDIPDLAAAFIANRAPMFPIYAVDAT